MKIVIILTVAVQMLAGLATAGIFFNEIKPNYYKMEKKIPIDVGYLQYKSLGYAREFYSLPYCPASKDLAYDETTETKTILGANMFDQVLHEHFMYGKV